MPKLVHLLPPTSLTSQEPGAMSRGAAWGAEAVREAGLEYPSALPNLKRGAHTFSALPLPGHDTHTEQGLYKSLSESNSRSARSFPILVQKNCHCTGSKSTERQKQSRTEATAPMQRTPKAPSQGLWGLDFVGARRKVPGRRGRHDPEESNTSAWRKSNI